jgi:hypothetical protein
MRLVWVDSKTGDYIPQQRRAYRCDLTWDQYPTWTEKEVDHLIKTENRKCRCRLHQRPSPFSSFSQDDKDIKTLHTHYRQENPPDTPPETLISNEQSDLGVGSPLSSTIEMDDGAAVLDPSLETLLAVGDVHKTTSEELDVIPNDDMSLFTSQDSGDPVMSLLLSPSHSMTPGRCHEENHLFFHYVSRISGLMMPIDDADNPWKSTYPSIAVQDASSHSTRALYHAMLAQSAFLLASSKGPERGVKDNASALRHYGIALRELRDSLATPTEEYSSVLAALLTLILAETAALGKIRTWRHHFRGAIGFVTQYLSRQPWLLSRDAWVITQSFALNIVLAQTAGNHGSSMDHISKVYGVLCDVTAEPRFGFTIGGNARLIKAVYRTLLLEEQISSTSRLTRGGPVVSEDVVMQAAEIIRQLRDSLKNDVDLYIQHREDGGHAVLPRARTLVKLHLHLFNRAVMIYLFRMVLRYPPSAVADYVYEVLTSAIVFLDMNGSEPSIWPVFIAAVEAYTLELQALANHFFDESKRRGTGLREDIRRVVCQVWADRVQLSVKLQCSPGEVSVDWREVTNRLEADVLLL